MYVTELKVLLRDRGDEIVATLSAHPPEAAARQGESPQGINSGLKIGEKGRGQLKGPEKVLILPESPFFPYFNIFQHKVPMAKFCNVATVYE